MPYALFRPRRPYSTLRPDHVSGPPRPKYITSDRAVAQVFYSYGWPVLHVPISSHPMHELQSGVPEWRDSRMEGNEAIENEEGEEDERSEEKGPSSTITRYGGMVELHYAGVSLEESMFRGPQVAERLKWNVMWVAGWTMDREVDLRYAL